MQTILVDGNVLCLMVKTKLYTVLLIIGDCNYRNGNQ